MRLILIALLLSTPTLGLAQEQRQLDAHEHGVGAVSIAISDSQLLLALEAPGVDIVGFEHAVTSEADQHTVAEALAALHLPENVIMLPGAAACRPVSAEAILHGGDTDHDEHGQDELERSEHTAFEAIYLFDCDATENLTTIRFSFFDQFNHDSQLRVQAVGSAGASAFTVTADQSEIDLSDLI